MEALGSSRGAHLQWWTSGSGCGTLDLPAGFTFLGELALLEAR